VYYATNDAALFQERFSKLWQESAAQGKGIIAQVTDNKTTSSISLVARKSGRTVWSR